MSAFVRQVLLRPARIGTLALLAGMISIVLVGAEGWWLVLGVVLFNAAAGMLTATWVDIPRTGLPHRVETPPSWVAPGGVPLQRRPRADE